MPSRPDGSPWRDLVWIAFAVVALIATGLGVRDPWPADEPRFASLARDMVASGDWLFPRVGGDLYQDKPPLFFWLLAAAYTVAGAWRAWFLLPSFFAATFTLLLVYDLGRRMAGRHAGLAAALCLATTIQFLLAARGAQIDATLCLLTTLSLYGLMRHLVLGPAWTWYAIAGAASGLGVITKGVGFLPLLMLLPYAIFARRGWGGLASIDAGGWRWMLAPTAFVLATLAWLAPMLWAVHERGTAELVAYRDELLFEQTAQRYASSWHHIRPWYYFLVEVIPVLWLPFSVLLFWLVPRWREAWRDRRADLWLPLAWIVLTVVFFSASPGKRGIYLLPALPALAIAAAPFLPQIFARRDVHYASLAAGALFALGALTFLIAVTIGVPDAVNVLARAELSTWPVAIFAALAVASWLFAWRRRPVAAWPLGLAMLAVVFSYGVAPAIDGQRSDSTFMRGVLNAVPANRTLGLVAYKEQFLLHLDRPVVNFGHRRWREGRAEVDDAARWLDGARSARVLLVPEGMLRPCFAEATLQFVGMASRSRWFLVSGTADPVCVARGDAESAIRYRAPRS